MDFTFENVDVKEELVQMLKKSLPKYEFKNVKVLKADPQGAGELPCIGINRIDDNETEQSISDAVETRYDSVNQKHYRVFGTFFSESIEIRVWHTNANERDRLYRHSKAILFANRLPLVEKGLLNVTLRTGRDEQDSSMRQAPMVLYWSSITMSYLNPLDVTFEEDVEMITAVPVTSNLGTDGEEDTTNM